MKQLELFVRIETGTDTQYRWALNPLFILLAYQAMAQVDTVAKLFGVYPKK